MKKNNEILLKELFDNNFGQLVLYANRMIGSRPVAEDLVQDVFLLLWEKRRLEDANTRFLYRCVKNASLNYLKTKEARIDHLSESILFSLSSDNESIEEEILRSGQIEKLYNAIKQLPPQCQMVFTACLSGKTKICRCCY